MRIGAKPVMCAFHRDDNKQLSVDGISLGAIAKQYGSPVYVYSAAGIIEAFTSFQNAVAPVNGKVYFAMKANSSLGVLALIGKLGGGMDIVSAGELRMLPASNPVMWCFLALEKPTRDPTSSSLPHWPNQCGSPARPGN